MPFDFIKAWICGCGPLLAFILIATDMQVGVGKKRSHLAEKRIEKFVDFSRVDPGPLKIPALRSIV